MLSILTFFLVEGGNCLSLEHPTVKHSFAHAPVPPTPSTVQPHGTHSRRSLFGASLSALGLASAVALQPPQISYAAVTDETNTFADNWWITPSTPTAANSANTLPSDELIIRVKKNDLREQKGLGLELAEIEFRTNMRVYVKEVRPDGLGSRLGIHKDFIVVGINGKSTERTNAAGVTQIISAAMQDPNDEIELRFRDPSIFRSRLQALSEGDSVTTQVAPSGDTTQRNPDGSVQLGRSVTSQDDQRITVTQLIAPKLCRRGATTDDLLEISYIGSVVETGIIFDGSAVKINGEGIPGRGNDVSLFFVLGKQPFGQFPPSWDVGLQGICVGERRRLIIPPALAYGPTGMPRRAIPPNATLQYDITLVSLNGLSTPQ
jgi:FK506-binding protein 2